MSVLLYLNCDSGDMEAFASLAAFRISHPEYKCETLNDRGDRIVERPGAPWPRYIGYLQETEVVA